MGLEMLKNLHHRGIEISWLEKGSQILRLMIPNREAGIRARIVVTERGARWAANLMIFAIGVRPETSLAKDAGLALNVRGGMIVSNEMRTSDPLIWAVGDAIERVRAGDDRASRGPCEPPRARDRRIDHRSVVAVSRRTGNEHRGRARNGDRVDGYE
jgi:NADPH-dependent 2,4-dienoyl-CoA reductase/sulfur reductase-like enzyme